MGNQLFQPRHPRRLRGLLLHPGQPDRGSLPHGPLLRLQREIGEQRSGRLQPHLNRTNGTVRFEYGNANGSITTNTYTGWKSAPTQAASTLRLTRTTPTQIRLQLGGQAGRGYELSSSPDLMQWTPRDYLLLDGVGATTALWNFDGTRQFFRIR